MDYTPSNPDLGDSMSQRSYNHHHDLPLLLFALIPMIIIVPVLPSESLSRPITIFFLCILFIAGIYSVRKQRRRFLMSCILALIASEFFFVSLWPYAYSLFLLGESFLLLFLIYQCDSLLRDLLHFNGTIGDLLYLITVLLLFMGILLGVALHLSGWMNHSVPFDPSSLHCSFGLAIPEGIILLLKGGESSFGTSPLTQVILMLGSIAGFFLLVISIGKIFEWFLTSQWNPLRISCETDTHGLSEHTAMKKRE